MRYTISCLVLIGLSPLAFLRAAEQPAKKDGLAALQGTWKVTAFEHDGNGEDLPQIPFWWTIQGDKVYYAGKVLATATVDAATTPRCFDLTFRESKTTLEGIYTLDKDTLKVCVNKSAEGVKERPTGFDTKGKAEWRLLTFQRDKDRKIEDLDGLGAFVGIQIKAAEDGKGILIQGALDNSPAKAAGLKADDLLLKVSGRDTTDLRGTVDMIRKAKPGSDLVLHIQRSDKEMDITIKPVVVPFFLLD